MMKRRKLPFAIASLMAVVKSVGCGRDSGTGAGDADINGIIADVTLTGNEARDSAAVSASAVQERLREAAEGAGKPFTIAAQTKSGGWETIVLGRAKSGTGGVSYAHPYIKIGERNAMHVSVERAGGVLGNLGKTVALQFRDASGNMLDGNGEPTQDPGQAMSWSVFTGAHAAREDDLVSEAAPKRMLQEDGAAALAGNFTKIFAIAIGAVVAFTVLKWVVGVIAFLAMQFLLFLAAAGFIAALAFLLDSVFGIDLTTDEGRGRFAAFLREVFAKLLEAARVVFASVQSFIDQVDYITWPPRIPEGAFNIL